MPQKRKWRFNFVDALILLAIVAAVLALLYVFVWSENSSVRSISGNMVKVTYVVEINGLEEDFKDTIKVGAKVTDSSKKMTIGTVASVETQDYYYLGSNVLEDKLVLNAVDDLITQYITVEAEATLDNITYSIDGYPIDVGQLVYMMFPEMVCSGYCISLDVAE